MKLGFNLLLWSTFVSEEHYPIIEKLKATGYDGVEVPVFTGDPEHYEKLGRFIKSLGLGVTTAGVMPGGGKSCVSADPNERAAALAHLKWMIDCASALGAELAAGPFHQPLGEFTGSGPTLAENARVAEVHKLAAQYAGKSGIRLSVEPLNRFECYFLNTAAQAAALVKAVDEPNYGYLYDTFHFNIEENSLVEVIPATIGQINHVHISENNRGAPGTGHIAFQPVFAALKAAGYDGWMTVEAFGSALPDLAAATKIWRPLFTSPENVFEGSYTLMRQGWDRA